MAKKTHDFKNFEGQLESNSLRSILNGCVVTSNNRFAQIIYANYINWRLL